MCLEEGGTLADLHANNMEAVSALPDHSEFWVGLYRNTSWAWHTGEYIPVRWLVNIIPCSVSMKVVFSNNKSFCLTAFFSLLTLHCFS